MEGGIDGVFYWTPDMVSKAVDYFQDEVPFHPLTCGNDSQNHDLLRVKVREWDGSPVLYCPTEGCDYIQTWIPEMVLQAYRRDRERIDEYKNEMKDLGIELRTTETDA